MNQLIAGEAHIPFFISFSHLHCPFSHLAEQEPSNQLVPEWEGLQGMSMIASTKDVFVYSIPN